MLRIIKILSGKPELIDDQMVFTMKPEAFANGLIECINSGACMIGGCCGTSAEHIYAIARRIKNLGKF